MSSELQLQQLLEMQNTECLTADSPLKKVKRDVFVHDETDRIAAVRVRVGGTSLYAYGCTLFFNFSCQYHARAAVLSRYCKTTLLFTATALGYV